MAPQYILIIIAAAIFGIIILVAIIKAATLTRYNKHKDFGYEVDKSVKNITDIPVLDQILKINPDFINNGLEKTNLCKANRVDPKSGVQLSLKDTFNRYPEEKVRLNCYLKCIKKFGKSRVELEFPIQVGSSKRFIDVAVFHGEKSNPSQSKEHTILNLAFIFECKPAQASRNIVDKDGNPLSTSAMLNAGERQLKSYMAVCPNLIERAVKAPDGKMVNKIFGLGCLTNGVHTRFYKKMQNLETGNIDFAEVSTPAWY